MYMFNIHEFINTYILHTPIQCTCTSSSSISVVDSLRDRKSSSGLAPLLPHPSPSSLTGGFLSGIETCGRDLYLKGGVALAPSLSSLEWSLYCSTGLMMGLIGLDLLSAGSLREVLGVTGESTVSMTTGVTWERGESIVSMVTGVM